MEIDKLRYIISASTFIKPDPSIIAIETAFMRLYTVLFDKDKCNNLLKCAFSYASTTTAKNSDVTLWCLEELYRDVAEHGKVTKMQWLLSYGNKAN